MNINIKINILAFIIVIKIYDKFFFIFDNKQNP